VSHRAALYTVRVKKSYTQDYRLLGDIDNAGTSLRDELASYLAAGFEVPNEDGTKIVRCDSVDGAIPDKLRLTLSHGENGVAAQIVDDTGADQYRQRSTDTQLLRCAGLFVLPPAQDRGWLALHVNNNRGVKGLLEVGLLQAFGNSHGDLRLEIAPYVHSAAFREAVEAGRIENIRLVKVERPDDRAAAATNRWVEGGEFGKIEVKIQPRGRESHLVPTLLLQFLGANAQEKSQVLNQIIEFQGISFDEAKVEVVLENNLHRTYNIENPSSGHPMTLDMEDLAYDADGEPREDSLFDALRDALATVR
jgi:hypothetical protein